MSASADHVEPRLLIVGDVERLGAIARELFAPMPIAGVDTYLAGIAELPRQPTRAVLVGVEPDCRRLESAVAALRRSAGAARLVYCCEPAYEALGRRAVAAGADDYVIFPPRETELERALGIASRRTRRDWAQGDAAGVETGTAELALLTELMAESDSSSGGRWSRMAELVRRAMGATHVRVTVGDELGEAHDESIVPQPRAHQPDGDDVLSETLVGASGPTGVVRVGPRAHGTYARGHVEKLRQYAALLGRLIEAARQTRHWRELAYRDDLTGLPNRRYLLQFLDATLARAGRERFAVTVLMFDIDDFKRYNDAYGHAAGDAIIRETGCLFVRCCRKQDVVCRYGGDEFAVVFWDAEAPRVSGSRHPEAVVAVLNRFRAALKSHRFSNLGPEAQGCLTLSGGLATYPWQAVTSADLLARADEALLAAKRAGKGAFWLVGSGDVCAAAVAG